MSYSQVVRLTYYTPLIVKHAPSKVFGKGGEIGDTIKTSGLSLSLSELFTTTCVHPNVLTPDMMSSFVRKACPTWLLVCRAFVDVDRPCHSGSCFKCSGLPIKLHVAQAANK